MVSGGLAEQWFLEVEIPIVRAELKTLTDIATSMRTIAKVSSPGREACRSRQTGPDRPFLFRHRPELTSFSTS